jgi:hypothetical protein
LDGTGDRGEYVIGVGSDQTDSSNDNDQDYRQHDCIFGDILSFLIAPKSPKMLHKLMPSSRETKFQKPQKNLTNTKGLWATSFCCFRGYGWIRPYS